jgi:hypothetical protein
MKEKILPKLVIEDVIHNITMNRNSTEVPILLYTLYMFLFPAKCPSETT